MLKIYDNFQYSEKFIEKLFENELNKSIEYKDILRDLDVLIFNKSEYTVEDIEEYNIFFSTKPYENKYKLAIFNNFEKVNVKQQNKLLKLYEESEAIHIICTQKINAILPTIKSRANIEHNALQKQKNIGESYPKRYHAILSLLLAEDTHEDIDIYLKFYDLLKNKKYEFLYLMYTQNIKNLDNSKVYSIIEYAAKESPEGQLNKILELQERLASNSIEAIHIEKYILSNIS